MTRDGIERDLEKTPYKTRVGAIVLHFSSAFYQRKFSQGVGEFCEKIFMKYKFDKFLLDYKQMEKLTEGLSIIFYSQIEKRGFMISEMKPKYDD